MAFESINPATGERIKRFDELSLDEMDRKLDLAETAFNDWRETDFDLRSDLFIQMAAFLRNEAPSFAGIITREMGKPIKQSTAEVEKCAMVCEYYAENAESFLSRRIVETDASQSYVRYDPLGPVLAVMPWNFPFWQVFRFAAPALMAGNAAVLKHASNVPWCAVTIEQVFRESGFPEGVFITLLISAKETGRVIRDPRIAAVTLTGSEEAGRSVASTAGKALKKSVLELGGSDPFIILSDADLQKAAQVGATSRLINTGQTCISAKRFIVVSEVAEEFTAVLRRSLESFKIGNPMKETTDVGPMAREDLREDLHKQVSLSVEHGAWLLMGGEIPEGSGYYYPVTLLSGVKAGMPVADEETFGPVACIMIVENEEHAIAEANSTPFGLGASLWTRDLERAHELAQRIEAGNVFVNGMVKSDPRLPFGGIKASGYGRELSEEGIREFMNINSVWMAE